MKLIEPGFLKRNKKLLIIALCLFLVMAVFGIALGSLNSNDNEGKISEMMHNANKTDINNAPFTVGSVELFIHNFISDMIVVIGGLLFSIVSVAITAFNAVSIAMPFGFDPEYAIYSILPHGIIEYCATILALTTAFIITKLEIKIIKNRNLKNTIAENRVMLKDILFLVIIITILLVIAAIIEGQVTPIIMAQHYGLL